MRPGYEHRPRWAPARPPAAHIETIGTLCVIQVDPDELVWASEIAERTNRSRQSIDQLVKGHRGPGNARRRLTQRRAHPTLNGADALGRNIEIRLPLKSAGYRRRNSASG
jgi:hypothetical protein